ncbi:MAG: hypothetical protein CL564_05070, partial [Alphaproteobacteria bacterium]|nr:hypothetical protein [Alphaproteobacteria bacterium]
KNLINFNLMKNMNKNSVIINIARGPIINEADLYKVLKNKIIRAAVIDVWYNYPKDSIAKKLYPSKYPLHKLDNITFSPHSSAWSSQLWDRRFKFVCENLENLYNKKRIKNLVN